MSDYTWIVTKDEIDGSSSAAIGRIGPARAKNRVRFDKVITCGQPFRLVGQDGVPRYHGYIIGRYQGHEPLQEFGREIGCIDIEYNRQGRWESVYPKPVRIDWPQPPQ